MSSNKKGDQNDKIKINREEIFFFFFNALFAQIHKERSFLYLFVFLFGRVNKLYIICWYSCCLLVRFVNNKLIFWRSGRKIELIDWCSTSDTLQLLIFISYWYKNSAFYDWILNVRKKLKNKNYSNVRIWMCAWQIFNTVILC